MATAIKNTRRVNRIAQVIARDNGSTAQDIKDGVTDLLTDIRHYCDAHGLDYGERDKSAYHHYQEEAHAAKRS
jgi:hypothetical protein